MKVRVFSFGVLKEWLGVAETECDLPEGATVRDLLRELEIRRLKPLHPGFAVSVNAEFSSVAQVLREGDTVGLLPPVSGGASRTPEQAGQPVPPAEGSVALTTNPIDAATIVARARQADDGAIVAFDGTVRNQTRGRKTLYLDYEAYQEMALRQMDELVRRARSQFGVRHATIVHRLGRLYVGETSVLIVVASAHRAQAFEACRWIIDTLKQTVPIWKKETFVDGVVWADGEPFPDGLSADLERGSAD